MMQLSPKATRFIIEAIEHYQASHEARLQDPSLPEEESAELANDYQYLEAVKTDLKKHHEELLSTCTSHAKAG
jgi:hypothetical protein